MSQEAEILYICTYSYYAYYALCKFYINYRTAEINRRYYDMHIYSIEYNPTATKYRVYCNRNCLLTSPDSGNISSFPFYTFFIFFFDTRQNWVKNFGADP